MRNFTKPIIYGVSALTYLDIFLNPNKGFSFLKISTTGISIIALVAVVSLLLLICALVFRKFQNVSKIAAIVFLLAALVIGNELLFSGSFLHLIDFFIALLLMVPIPLIINDRWNFKKSRLLIPGALFLMGATLIFFCFFYTPYEGYFAGFPILFIHHWIRNWLIVIAAVLLTLGILKKNDH